MLHRNVEARFQTKHGKFKEHASKIFDKTSVQHAKFPKHRKNLQKFIQHVKEL